MADRAIHPIVAKLASYRQALGLSQEAVAGRVGVARHAVLHWESGRHQPTLWDVALYAEAVGARLVIEVPEGGESD